VRRVGRDAIMLRAGMMVCPRILGIRRPYDSYPDVGCDDK
jgi:hypothetical protein